MVSWRNLQAGLDCHLMRVQVLMKMPQTKGSFYLLPKQHLWRQNHYTICPGIFLKKYLVWRNRAQNCHLNSDTMVFLTERGWPVERVSPAMEKHALAVVWPDKKQNKEKPWLTRIGNHLSLTGSAADSQRNNVARYEWEQEKQDFSYQKACSQLVALSLD
jgi:hypothetical protein